MEKSEPPWLPYKLDAYQDTMPVAYYFVILATILTILENYTVYDMILIGIDRGSLA